ncbi:MAG: hypothetical protein JWO30_1132 [Fibrobacteres bacterium]|nr:hypothetical protein [Fibrobacterota bacterium]
MISIFKYSDYRLFLRDWLQAQKAGGRPITYEALGEAAGFTSKGFLTQILQGKTNLPERMIGRISKALELKKKERDYFALLVGFNQAKRASERAELHRLIQEGFKADVKALALEQFEYYQKWYYSAIRSLLGYHPFSGDFADLAKQLEPPITTAQAKRAVHLLEELGLILRGEDGQYRLTDRLITSGESFVSHAVIQFQRETMDLAKEALETFPKEKRSGSTLTLGLSEAGYKALEEKLKTLRREMVEIARFDKEIDRVIQVNLHAFPLTRKPKGGKR